MSSEEIKHLRRKKPWTLAIILSLLALSLGAIAARKAWRSDTGRDPARLELLYEAVKEYDARHEEKAIELLDHRAAERRADAAGLDAPGADRRIAG